jgi:chorismate dehydratase
MLHGAQRELFDLSFRTPAKCADALADGSADIGIVPVVEVQRQRLEAAGGSGIACHGAVRSILLISKVPGGRIRTLAADSNSRTSVILSRIFLAERFGASPEVIAMQADLPAMLEAADAALIIGDAALYLDPETLPYHVWDLGAEWSAMTGLPMVFAVWAGRPGRLAEDAARAFDESAQFGRQHLDDIVREQTPVRGLPEALVREYLLHNLVLEIGAREREGMATFLKLAKAFDTLKAPGIVSV